MDMDADQDQPNREETLFAAARVLREPEQRSAFLYEACKDDDNLRSRVEAAVIAVEEGLCGRRN